MNAAARAAVTACPNCKRAAKWIYFHLQDLADEGLFLATIHEIAARANTDQSCVFRSLKSLVACGHIAVQQRQVVGSGGARTCNVYLLTMPTEAA